MWVAEIKRLKYYNTKRLTAFNGNKLYLFFENHRTLIFSLTLELSILTSLLWLQTLSAKTCLLHKNYEEHLY